MEGASENAKAQARSILGPNRESEFLQSFVRVDLGDDDVKEEAKSLYRRSTELHLPKQSSTEAKEKVEEAKGERPQSPPPGANKAQTVNFKQLKKSLRVKKKKARREEEVYTDKDRAAAVNMGSRDIKQSLSMKQRQDRTQALDLPVEADSTTLLALGRNEMRGGNTSIAFDFINKALELSPDDKNALIARSKCHLLLGEPRLALVDAETALNIDKNFVKAIYQKAEALYYLGDFEHSLMFYHRGLRLRPDMQGFRLGILKAQEAIENTIGQSDAAKPPKKREEKKVSMDPSKPPAKKTGKASRSVLGQLYVDKEYLENLLKHPDLNVADRKSNSIAAYAEDAIKFLNNREEFWRQQRASD